MKKHGATLTLGLAIVGAATNVLAQPTGRLEQAIVRAGSQPSTQAPEQNFTGKVRVEPLFQANESAPYSGAYVTFDPGARSAWHVHPAGQRLVVTAGTGRTGTWGGRAVEIKAGDVVWCPPGVKHWHGAAPDASMTHLAISGVKDGKTVEWMEKVSDDEYRR
jgi:quercetin dioxygenase-like cupin family protein